MNMPSQEVLRPFVIGIAGGTGAGKTTVALALAARHASLGAVVVDQDSYYKDQTLLTFEQRVLTNYDQPSALDFDLMVRQMQRLAAGDATIPAMVEKIYAGVDKRLHPAAAMVVLAHLEDLVERSEVAAPEGLGLFKRYEKN